MKMKAAVMRVQGKPRPYVESHPMTIETAGAIAAMNMASAIAARGGMIVSAGLPSAGANFSFPRSALVTDEKSISGSYMGSCVPKRDIPRFIALYQRGRLPVNKLRGGFIPFDQINEGFDKLADGMVPRQVPRPHA